MLVNVKEFLEHADIREALYPGKRLVKPCKQIGQYKNHCIVIDWRDPEIISIDIKPGISGKQLAPEVVKEYPVCFQTPTYVKIKVMNDDEEEEKEGEEEEGEEGKSKGKSGGGGKKPAQKKKSLEDIQLIAARFSESAEGHIPSLGEIKEMMVMGVEIAKEAFGTAFTELTRQINHARISATEILAKSANLVTRVTPPGFLKPKGDETQLYKYDREKNADIGTGMSLG
ncbi:MAG: hypothetical protein KAJ40_06450 [Alphaproteobacteria bacterium]|nr:hypothetical protein [Alphaproteobacteria bacterium]